ncbi:B3/4 domain-containing protein [Pseudomonas sp. GD03858]|uniref:B3/B4 domain-containing protein n=1 Tax=unclassified Pseudomonas TaxID=196821 RepID=UPI00244AD013|nr:MULTISPECIES: B3/4 domain-containing protein [unclassified Pseudomonas]MDH0645882.1 B3/4 domain-containing protein [Pseudomonas sp. GD03867]MDH0661510.1 B3/4 domain-containing protein [Pseudomonas sp. GD03858]
MLLAMPSIDPAIKALAPGFRALSITVQAAPIRHPEVASQALASACQAVLAGQPAWAPAHLQAWADVFSGFGAKPQRTPCSAQALRKRVLRDGLLPAIDPVVDLYNAISLAYAIPVGGENLEAYVGAPRLVVAEGSEQFDTFKDGALIHEAPLAGEVVWRDEVGVTCRRWNWRQGVRTRLDAQARQMWFVLESLPAMPPAALQEAGGRLAEDLARMMPGALVEQRALAV